MLKKARDKKKITQEELSLRLNVNKSYISRLEKHPSTCNPTVKLILGLSKELGIAHTKIYKYFVENINDPKNEN
ncbi:helix-turn-helix domain-containing protein [Clostridium sp.]|uniref:helix-turn-helix domain-containing protein n=1 Tax=Clostridium sp. TaxID=1506 RepID=UPI002614D4DD|nr:helix-turn-helix transcriptional regulator [Clostridium sp.]